MARVDVYKNSMLGPRTDCNNILSVSGLNASSLWDKDGREHNTFWSSRNMDSSHEFLHWAADLNDLNPWVELGLSDRSTITGTNVQMCLINEL